MIVFTDLDGTLLDERGELGPAREALERLRAAAVTGDDARALIQAAIERHRRDS